MDDRLLWRGRRRSSRAESSPSQSPSIVLPWPARVPRQAALSLLCLWKADDRKLFCFRALILLGERFRRLLLSPLLQRWLTRGRSSSAILTVGNFLHFYVIFFEWSVDARIVGFRVEASFLCMHAGLITLVGWEPRVVITDMILVHLYKNLLRLWCIFLEIYYCCLDRRFWCWISILPLHVAVKMRMRMRTACHRWIYKEYM